MSRGGLLAVSILLGAAVTARADDVEGTVTAVDQVKRTVAVKVGDAETKYELTADCKVYIKVRLPNRNTGYNEDKRGLKAVVVGATVTVSTDFQDGKDVATRIKIETGAQARVPKKN